MIPDRSERTPLVTVVIPAYNAGRYISECLESVAIQSGPFEIEIVVVDDGSTDDTMARVRAFGPARLIQQANAGPSAARNRGIAEARGDFVAFLDSDDRWAENKLAKQMEIFRVRPEVGMVFGDCLIFDEDTPRIKSMFTASELDESFWGDPVLVRDAYCKLYRLNYVPTGTAVVRRDCFRIAGTFDETMRYVEDFDLWLRIAMHFPLAYTTHVCELKRQHDANVSNSADAMALGLVDVLNKQQRLFGGELKRCGVRVRPRIARAYCRMGDRHARDGKTGEARRLYLKGLREYPSLRTAYYWLRSLLVHWT